MEDKIEKPKIAILLVWFKKKCVVKKVLKKWLLFSKICWSLHTFVYFFQVSSQQILSCVYTVMILWNNFDYYLFENIKYIVNIKKKI